MNHADGFLVRGHDWAAAVGSVLLMAMVLGIASNQSRWFLADSHLGAHSVAAAAHEVVTIARLAAPQHETFPPVLTVPFAVTRTQRMMVARKKQRADADSLNDRSRTSTIAGPRFLTGLALLGVSQSSSNQ